MSRLRILYIAIVALSSQQAGAATLVGEYTFGSNSLASNVSGGPALTAVDPSSTNSFGSDNVLGVTRSIYNFTGSSSPASAQGGLQFSNTASGYTVAANSYSVEIIFKLNERSGQYRRIFDTLNRTSDAGFYVDPSNNLQVFPNSDSSLNFTSGTWYDVVLTNNGGSLSIYNGGNSNFTTTSAVLNVSSANVLGFFLDNTSGGGQGEWSSGSVAKIALWNGVLTSDEVKAIYNVNTTPTTPVPAPAGLGLFGLSLAALGLARRARG
jgi:hypothetical protein